VVNIWAGIVSDFLIGPYLLFWWHNAQIYHVFLEEKLPEMLEEFPLSVSRKRGSSTTGLRLTLHVRSENILLPLTMITGLDRAGQ
jgi:hypothetical protein